MAEEYYDSSDKDYPELRELLEKIKPQSSIWKLRQQRLEAAQRAVKQAAFTRNYENKTESLHGQRPSKMPFTDYYWEVRTYLRMEINDPSSLDIETCTNVLADTSVGWKTTCIFRMKNKFGGLEKYTWQFSISNGEARMTE